MFSEKLRQLLDLLRASGIEPPRRLLVGEVGPSSNDERGFPVFRSQDLVLAENYDKRFGVLMSEGYPWVNLCYYGTVVEWGLVAIELPAPERRRQELIGSTVVNLSGPSKRVTEHGGDALSYIALDGPLPSGSEGQ